MKRMLILLFVLSVGNIQNQKSLSAPNPPEFVMQFGFFYFSLSPLGEWIEAESGARVWRPFHIPHQWRPYLNGQWVWTDYGWYWMSNEPFGWITYHYGRWYNDDSYGWVWIRDNVWGPAWVEWRYDDDYIGWAPLPPYATFNVSTGMRFTTHWTAPLHYWNFIRYYRFGSVIRYRDIASGELIRRLIHTTRTGSKYEVNHDRIINRGVDRAFIERHGNLRISRTEVLDVHEQSGERITRSDGNRRTERIEIYRPTRDEMQHDIEHIEVRRSDRALSIDMKKIERPHEYTPQMQEREQHQDRKEMRRELIQRYERKHNPTPPTRHREPQKRIDRHRESSPRTHPNRYALKKRSSRSSTKRRDE
jgi:hypothetical protein